MKYINVFDTHSNYNTYINNQDKVLPNMSYCVNDNECHYNPWVETRVIGIFTVIDDTQKTAIMSQGGCYWISEVDIDGVNYKVEDTDNGMLQLSLGTHTVKYTLINPTAFGGSIDGVLDYCTSLTSVMIPNSITSIGDNAFYGCTGLTSVSIPNSVTSIGFAAFYGCTGLTSITVDSGNTVYNSRNNCNAIIKTSTNELIVGCKNTIIPNTVTSIGDNAFFGCTGLTSINIPNSVISISDDAFGSCTGLTNITIGNSVTSIGGYAFSGCSGITSIISLATTAPTIYNNTFQNIKTNGTLTVPSGSSGYDVWMGTGNYYLGKYSWTKVEQ